MKLTTWHPFSEIETLHDRINRIFQETMATGDRQEELGSGAWLPAVDVQEDETSIIFQVELAGMKKEDITVSFEDKALTISGERTFEREAQRDSFRRVERSYGRFSRRFTVGKAVRVEDINAAFTDGVLTVTLPKVEEARPKQISISVS